MKFKDKIIEPSQALEETINRLKSKNKKIVFTNGCFDILHLGHLLYLEEGKEKGDILIVALNSDQSVKKLKGETRPINDLNTRLAVIASLFFVDFVTWFEEDTPYNLIKKIIPDVLIKGGDWKPESIVGADIVKENKGEVLSIRFLEGKSTTSIIEKIKKN